MQITWVSRRGGHKINEDAAGKLNIKGITCIVIADGLGGHNGGSMASRLAVEAALNEFAKMPEVSAAAVKSYIDAANDAIVKKAAENKELEDMSSTIAVLVVKKKTAVWGHVGDSRIYRIHLDKIEEVTEDHSVAFEKFKNGEIEYGEIRSSRFQNRLLNALGIGYESADISEVTEVDNFTSFLMCTDGFWEYVNEDDIEHIKKKSKSNRDWFDSMLRLCEHNAPNNCDNYTAAAILI